MRKIYNLFLIALGFAAIMSCAKEISDPQQGQDELPSGEVVMVPMTFSALAEEGTEPEAKSSLNSDATKVQWTEDDRISVFGNTGDHGVLEAGSITENVAQFSGSVESVGPYYAVTPHNEANALTSAGKLQVVVPAVQTPIAAKGNVDPASLVAVGMADEENAIYFYNVCGMLAIEIEDATVTEVCLQGGADNALAGKAVVAYSDKPSVESVAEASNKVTIQPEEETFAAGTYYVSVLPGTIKGLTMTITKGEGKTVVYTVPNDIVVNRSVVRSVGKSTENEYVYNGYITDVESLNAFLAKASESTSDAPVRGVILNDLDLSGATVTAATVLYGELDGREHYIKNWKNNAGTLIAENNGTVKNVFIDKSCTLTAPSELVAADFGVLITKQGDVGKCIGCKNYADISVAPTSMSTTWRFAPLIGHNDQGYLEGCENYGNVTVTLNNAQTHDMVMGGVVGYCKGDVVAGKIVAKNCKNFGNVVLDAKNTVKANSVGGVFGATPVHAASEFKNTGVFSGCVNSGNVTYTIGVNDDASYTNVGGVIGYCEGDMESCSNSGAITHRNSTTHEVACVRPSVGGVAGCVGYSMKNCKNTGLVEFSGYSKHGSLENFAGGCIRPAFGGVVGSIGSSADITGSVLQNCNNSGELKVINHMVPSSEEADRIEPMMGGVAGYARVGVSFCDNETSGTITVSSSGYYNCVGGIVGRVWGNNTMINCSNAAALSVSTFGNGTNQATNAIFGGVAGRVEKATNQCDNSGNISFANNGNSSVVRAGGLIGYTKNAINESGNTGDLTFTDVKGAAHIGGVLGYADGTAAIISGCENGGDVIVGFSATGTTAYNYVGGIAGLGQALTSCTNSGNVTTTNKKVRLGGLAGQAASTITGCYVLDCAITLKNAVNDSEVGGFAAYCNANISASGFSGVVDNQSTTATYTGGLVAAVRGKDNPTISDTYLSVDLKAANAEGYNGLIYGGQYDPSQACTITLGQSGKTLKVLNTSKFVGALVSKDTTPLVGRINNTNYQLTVNSEFVEFVDSLPTDSGSTTSAFQPASNWTGTWN